MFHHEGPERFPQRKLLERRDFLKGNYIAEINADYSPDFVVLDGVDAFVGGGPAQSTRMEAGVLVAGSDRVAIGAVGVDTLRSLGTTAEVNRGLIFEQEQIARAIELGLGVKLPDQI